MAQVGLGPTASLVLSQGGLPNCLPGRAPGRSRTGNRLRPPLRGGARAKPLCQLAYLGNQVAPDGVEPSFPGCGPSVVAVGPRGCVIGVESPGIAPGFPACGAGVVLLDHDPEAEVVGLEPTSGCSPPPVFKTGSSSGRMTSVVVYQKLRRLESNQHEDVQSVSSYR